jgi:hypothetical protein
VKTSEPTSSKPPEQGRAEEFGEETGLPWFRTWRGVYLFVLGSLVLWIALLYALSVLYP